MNDDLSFPELESFSHSDLKNYVEARLRLISLIPPISRSHQEEPEDFLIEAIKRSVSTVFVSNIHKVIAELLAEEWSQVLIKSNINSDFLARLLILIEMFLFSRAHPTVLQMASNSNLLRGNNSIYSLDLYGQALRTLAFLQEGPPGYIELWTNLFRIEALSPYQAIAFQGMALCGFDLGLEGLRLFAEYSTDDKIAQIGLSIAEFIQQYQTIHDLSKMVDFIIEKAADLDRSGKQRLCFALKTIPQVASEHYSRIVAELLMGPLRPALNEEYKDDETATDVNDSYRRSDRAIRDIMTLVTQMNLLEQLRSAVVL